MCWGVDEGGMRVDTNSFASRLRLERARATGAALLEAVKFQHGPAASPTHSHPSSPALPSHYSSAPPPPPRLRATPSPPSAPPLSRRARS